MSRVLSAEDHEVGRKVALRVLAELGRPAEVG
jgi:hypothetical protein